jgi:signal peptidase I
MVTKTNPIQPKEQLEKAVKEIYLAQLARAQTITLNISGVSMAPFLRAGDRIRISSFHKENIKTGDIVVVDNKEENKTWFYVHRVVNVLGAGGAKIYITKGDAQKKGFDAPVQLAQIIGKVREIYRSNNTKINLETPFWKFLNPFLSYLSRTSGSGLRVFSYYLNLLVEWRLFPAKIKRRLKKGVSKKGVRVIFMDSFISHLVKGRPKNHSDPFLTENLLLLCSRKDLNEEAKAAAASLIDKGVDWEKIADYALRGYVVALVYNAIRELELPPADALILQNKLKAPYLYIVSQSVCKHNELIKILRLFSEKNIFALPLKGTFLAKRLYGDIYWRDLSSDFDLLIKEGDRLKARNLLQEAGYISTSDDREEYLGSSLLIKPEATSVDLHWSIVPKFKYGRERTEGLLKAITPVEEEGARYFEFKAEELLLYLSAHLASSSCFRQLRYVCDINALLIKYKQTINWDSLADKAKLFRLSSSLYTALRLTHNFFSTEAPLQVLKKIKVNPVKFAFIGILANKKVMLQPKSKRKKLIDDFFSLILLRIIEGELWSVFFPPRPASITKNYFLRMLKGLRIIWAVCVQGENKK